MQRGRAGAGQPFARHLSYELRPVVRATVLRDAVFDHRIGQHVNFVRAFNLARTWIARQVHVYSSI